MSRFGSPGEPTWPGPGPEEYGAPSDPWEPQPASGWGEPTMPHQGAPPGYPPPAGGAPPAWAGGHAAAPEPAGPHAAAPPAAAPRAAGPPPGSAGAGPRRPRPVGLYLVVTVLVLVAATGVGYALFLLSGDGGDSQLDGSPTTGPSGQASPSGPEPTRDNVGMNAAMALVDDCLVNDGTAAEPQMRIVPCDAGEDAGPVFQVLEIFGERVAGEGAAANEQAQQICASTEGYTHHYYEVGETASFVLCMAELE